ncbi:rod shape-determining protein MreC [Sphingomonas oleivorans]|uniref:Cell shape-determining protein MreC n=1 Tax=Sphingomonas oleivorans TaxID=1735121 RepID=A0A2T5FWE2_9SPHN|nr:rod shape-determining protein MreC [Sphingomonas oleivorans]PTQ10089.1 rod shape-determining protein MreC [Sphingomonas oleivorans]
MAPSRHRRRGFSRRVQYTLFAGYVVAVVGVVVAAALILIARFDPLAFSALRGLVLDAGAPVSAAGRSVVRGGETVSEEIGAYFNAAAQNRALRQELAVARRKLVAARAVQYENARLKRILHLTDNGRPPVAVARLIGSDAAGHRRFATLSAGSSSGVRPGLPVRGADGLIGRIFETGRFASRVLLLTDGGSTVPVRVARSGQPALAIGRGDGGLDLRALASGGRPFQKGDLVVTSGTGGIYAPNLPVAVVVNVDRELAVARPVADPARLDFAIVDPVFQIPLPPPSDPLHRDAP